MSKKCIYCGSPLPDDASFCPSCATSQIRKRKLRGPMLSRKVLWAAAGLFLLVLLGLLILPRLSGAWKTETPETIEETPTPTVDMDRIRQRTQDWLNEHGTDYSTDLYEYTETTPYGNTVTHVILNTINVCTYYTTDGIFGEEIRFPKVSGLGNYRSLYFERTSEDADDLLTDGYDLQYREYYYSGVPYTYVVGYKWKSTEGHVILYDERYNVTEEFDVPDCKAYLDEHRLRKQDVVEEYTELIRSGQIQLLYQ